MLKMDPKDRKSAPGCLERGDFLSLFFSASLSKYRSLLWSDRVGGKSGSMLLGMKSRGKERESAPGCLSRIHREAIRLRVCDFSPHIISYHIMDESERPRSRLVRFFDSKELSSGVGGATEGINIHCQLQSSYDTYTLPTIRARETQTHSRFSNTPITFRTVVAPTITSKLARTRAGNSIESGKKEGKKKTIFFRSPILRGLGKVRDKSESHSQSQSHSHSHSHSHSQHTRTHKRGLQYSQSLFFFFFFIFSPRTCIRNPTPSTPNRPITHACSFEPT